MAGILDTFKLSKQELIHTMKSSLMQTSGLQCHPLEEMLGETLHTSTGDSVFTKVLAATDGLLGLYFASDIWPLCHVFTTLLVRLYRELRTNNSRPFEVILVPGDGEERLYRDFFANMPWLSVDFGDMTRRRSLAKQFCVPSLPHLVLMDVRSLQVVSHRGTDLVKADPLGRHFPWTLISSSSMPPTGTTQTLITPETFVEPTEFVRESTKSGSYPSHNGSISSNIRNDNPPPQVGHQWDTTLWPDSVRRPTSSSQNRVSWKIETDDIPGEHPSTSSRLNSGEHSSALRCLHSGERPSSPRCLHPGEHPSTTKCLNAGEHPSTPNHHFSEQPSDSNRSHNIQSKAPRYAIANPPLFPPSKTYFDAQSRHQAVAPRTRLTQTTNSSFGRETHFKEREHPEIEARKGGGILRHRHHSVPSTRRLSSDYNSREIQGASFPRQHVPDSPVFNVESGGGDEWSPPCYRGQSPHDIDIIDRDLDLNLCSDRSSISSEKTDFSQKQNKSEPLNKVYSETRDTKCFYIGKAIKSSKSREEGQCAPQRSKSFHQHLPAHHPRCSSAFLQLPS